MGLALAVALAGHGAAAQAVDTSAHLDSLRAHFDSLHAGDTTAHDTLSDTTKVPKDTIAPPIAQAEVPPVLAVGQRYTWNRTELFATGATTLFELLQRVPGLTAFRAGWLPSEQHASYLGNPARIRIFLDGLEIDPLDQRSGPALDTYEIQIWALESVTLERGADEMRIYARSWSVTRTSASSRIDIETGDLSTNMVRGFFGKRFAHGMIFQFGAQAYGTTDDPRFGGGGDLGLFSRFGWSNDKFSADVFISRDSRDLDQQQATLPQAGLTNTIAALSRTRTDAYLRLGYGQPDSSLWGQIMAAREIFAEDSPFNPPGGVLPADSADTTTAVTQLVFAGGLTRWGLRLSATERVHFLPGGTLSALSGRLAYERGIFALSLHGEHRNEDSSSTEEAQIRVSPFSFLSVLGAVTRRHGGSDTDGSIISGRGELGIHFAKITLTGGVMYRGAVVVPGLPGLDTAFVPAQSAGSNGFYGTINGKIWRDIGVDIWGVRWSSPGFYRPQLQSREELYLDTKWLRQFPSGHFGLLASVAHEYRSDMLFPVTGATEAITTNSVVTVFSNVLAVRLEIRILDVVAFYYASFGISPTSYEYVPGYLQTAQRALYGVRWQFWN